MSVELLTSGRFVHFATLLRGRRLLTVYPRTFSQHLYLTSLYLRII
jgi:hypothetical protein